jgi:phytoene dehydrogenase-like protein
MPADRSGDVDAVVIGSGPNGLVAANVLADHGWDVVVLEAAAEPGGAVRSAEVTAPGFTSDLYSAFYPLAAVSPALRALDLDRHGLRWSSAPRPLAHPTPDGPTLVIDPDLDVTAASLDRFAPGRGDGDTWRALFALFDRVSPALFDALLTPFPPVRPAVRLAGLAGPQGLVDVLQLGLGSARGQAHRRFEGEGGALLFGGNALHTDLLPESASSAIYGWLLSSLAQQVGWPVPVGGAGELTAALVRRLEANGGRVECGAKVTEVVVRAGRAAGVRSASGDAVSVRRAVLADVGAPALYLDLLEPAQVPGRVRRAIGHFEYGDGTFKVDWALRAPIPWADPEAATAGTVHVGDSLDELSRTARELADKLVPRDPFLLVGQMTTADPTRSPEGTESAWAYAHVPRPDEARGDAGHEGLDGTWRDPAGVARFAARMEARIERLAPGFTDRIIARHVASPVDLQEANANLVGGALDGGSARLRQQLFLRPIPGLGRAETPVKGLFLASASAHPGGGVHGACGNNAAQAALRQHK